MNLSDLAQTLAAQSRTLCPPNPSVGCVLVNAAGDIIGQGATQRRGGPHAEVMALRDAATNHRDVRGATAYVTLEPCAHQGRTGPCCDALIAAGVCAVVAACEDPNPLVGGQGFARLRAAGVAVTVGGGAAQTHALNIGFFSRMLRARPWVRLKVAASLDGVTALPNGQSQWITSPEARADGHAWRARACAVLSGSGTVLADDPRLDVRLVATPRQPHRVVLDSLLRTPPGAALFSPADAAFASPVTASPAAAGSDIPQRGGQTREVGAVWIYASREHEQASAERARSLTAAGAQISYLGRADGAVGSAGGLDLHALLADLAAREVNELHVEAGATLNAALMAAGLVDEVIVYLAPTLLGRGRGLTDLGPLSALSEGTALRFESAHMVGPDLRVVARTLSGDGFFADLASRVVGVSTDLATDPSTS